MAKQVNVARDVERARNSAFAENLRLLMGEHGLTTRDLAAKLSISHQAISQWLSAQNGPSNRRLAQVANFFHVKVQRLISVPVFDLESEVKGSDKAADTVPIRQLGTKLAASGLELELPAPDEKTVLWNIPLSALTDDTSTESNIVVLRVGHHGLEPEVKAGDYIFADVACRTVSTSGIYLLVIACLPAWRRCEPLVGENVLVIHGASKQEVPAEDLAVLGRAVWLLTEP